MNVSSHRSKLPTGCFIDDFGASVQESGPKLRRLVAPTTKQIESLLDRLISPFIPEPPRSPISKFLQKALPRRTSDRIAQPIESLLQKVVPQTAGSDVTPEYTIDPIVRTDVKQHLEQLDTELAADAAIIEAWRDLVTSAEKLNRTVDELAYRRDTLYAIAERRNLDTVGPFGVSADLRRLLTDVPDAVQQELDNEAGRDHAPIFPPQHTAHSQRSAGLATPTALRERSNPRAGSRRLHRLDNQRQEVLGRLRFPLLQEDQKPDADYRPDRLLHGESHHSPRRRSPR